MNIAFSAWDNISPNAIQNCFCHTTIIKNLTPKTINTVYAQVFGLWSAVPTCKAQPQAFSKCERITGSNHHSWISINTLLHPKSNQRHPMLGLKWRLLRILFNLSHLKMPPKALKTLRKIIPNKGIVNLRSSLNSEVQFRKSIMLLYPDHSIPKMNPTGVHISSLCSLCWKRLNMYNL